MLLQIFTVFDSKAEAYLPPFYMTTKGQAIRAFSDSVNDPTHVFMKHPEDYTLFLLGSFEDTTASFHVMETGLPLGKAIEYMVPREGPMTPLVDMKGSV